MVEPSIRVVAENLLKINYKVSVIAWEYVVLWTALLQVTVLWLTEYRLDHMSSNFLSKQRKIVTDHIFVTDNNIIFSNHIFVTDHIISLDQILIVVINSLFS